MKKTTYTASLLIVACLVVVAACTKDIKDTTTLRDDFTGLARVQVYNSTLSTQRNIVYVDGNPVNGLPLSYTQTTATNAAFVGSGNVYGVNPGTRALLIKDTLPAAIQPPLSFSYDFQANKSYTIFTYDSVNAIKQTIVANDIVVPADGTARVRFANFVYLKGSVPPPVDIFSKNKNANVFTNVGLSQVTDYIPYEAGKSETFIVFSTGTMDTLAVGALNPTKARSYTLIFRGRYTTKEATGAFFPRTLANFVNY